MNEFRPVVESFTDTLQSQLSKRLDQELIVTDWFNFYSYDVMSFMAFGISMDMMEVGEPNLVLTTTKESIVAVGFLSHIPWVVCMLMTFPSLLTALQDVTNWSRELVNQRKAVYSPLFPGRYLMNRDTKFKT